MRACLLHRRQHEGMAVAKMGRCLYLQIATALRTLSWIGREATRVKEGQIQCQLQAKPKLSPSRGLFLGDTRLLPHRPQTLGDTFLSDLRLLAKAPAMLAIFCIV